MRKNVIVFGIVLLFLGLAFAPIANSSLIQTEFKNTQDENIDDLETRTSLFTFILDAVNDPEIQEFFNKIMEDIDFSDVFDSNIEINDIIDGIKTKNPRLYYSIIFSRSSFNYKYLEKSYKQGIEIINLIGEDDSGKIINTLNLLNERECNDFEKILFNKEEYKDEIENLKELNTNLKKDEPLKDWPIICSILIAIQMPWFIHIRFMTWTWYVIFRGTGILAEIWGYRVAFNILLYAATVDQILRYFDCIGG